MTAPIKVYYDGGCPICSCEVDMYRARLDADAFQWVDIHLAELGDLGPGLSRDLALERMHVRLGDGTLLSGAAAFGAIWRHLPGMRWLGRSLLLPPILAIAEFAYRGFLVVRKFWRPE